MISLFCDASSEHLDGGHEEPCRCRCDVVKHLHKIMDYPIDDDADTMLPHFDTVRGMFTEGEELYDGAAFYRQSHVQVAVRSVDCIRGYFFPPEVEGFFLNPN